MNSGNANRAAIRIILWSLAGLIGFFAGAWIGVNLGGLVLAFHKVFIALWIVFVLAVVYLTRDPNPIDPSDPNAIVAPAHGRVDVIEDQVENELMEEPCRRISIAISLLDAQVQYAPIAGKAFFFDHNKAIRSGGTAAVETLLIGFQPAGHPEGRVGIQLIAGSWGRRIAAWIKPDDVVSRGERIAMMKPGTRVNLFLPSNVKVKVSAGEKVIGGTTVVAKFE